MVNMNFGGLEFVLLYIIAFLVGYLLGKKAL